MKLPTQCEMMSWEWIGSDGRHVRTWLDGERRRQNVLKGGQVVETLMVNGNGYGMAIDHVRRTIVQIPESAIGEVVDPDQSFEWSEERRFMQDGREIISFVTHSPKSSCVRYRRLIDSMTGCRILFENFLENGSLCFRMEALNLDVKKPDDSLFVIPDGYRVTKGL